MHLKLWTVKILICLDWCQHLEQLNRAKGTEKFKLWQKLEIKVSSSEPTLVTVSSTTITGSSFGKT